MKKYLDIRSRVASTSSQHSNPPSNPPSRPTSSQSMHSVNSLNAIIRPRSTVPSSNSTTTLPPLTKSASSRMVDTRHSRTVSSSSTQPLSRSDSAPLTSKPSSTSIRPLVGPSRPRPLSGASRPTDNREMPPPQIIPIRLVSSLSDNGPNSHKLSSAPQRPGVFQPPAAALPVTPGGPLRPMLMREPVDQEGQPLKPRVVGGARRVPKPQPPPEEPVQPLPKAVAQKQKGVDPAKSTSRAGSVPAHSRSGSATSKNETQPAAVVEKKASTNKDASSNSRLPDAATKSKTSAPSNSNSKATLSIAVSKKPDSARNTNATSKTTTTTMASTTRRSATSATANSTSRLTAPTQAQLARQKSIASAAQKTDATKVARGNSNRGGAIPPTKTQLPPKVTARKPSVQAHRKRSKTPGVAKPLVEPTIAAKFPLPISRPSSPSPSVQTCPTDDENRDKDNDSEVPVSETEAEADEEVEDEEVQADGDGVETEIKVEEEDVQIPVASSEAEHAIKSEEDSESELESEPTVIISPCDLPKEHSSQSPHNSPPPTNSPATPGLDPSIPKFLICSPSPSSSSSSQSGDDPSTPKASFPLTPNSNHNNQYPTVPETPISSLLASIQMGFEFNSPAPPFDPDQTSSLGGMLVYDKCEPLAIGHT
ncbi:hypothetical protein C8Q75DRAFT_753850 [Abortiporus biennis]|nr:hypothetical protein C8Q75DRAFT_753850 [Abortiporus biennis]